MGRQWPSEDDYKHALLSPERVLRKELATVRVDLHNGAPTSYSGNFGVVFKYTDRRRRSFALKAFVKHDATRDVRHETIQAYLDSVRSTIPELVSYAYDREGIFVGQSNWPTATMEWVEGKRLDKYIALRNGAIENGLFCSRFAGMMLGLARHGIAHGDFQSGNIYVTEAGLFRLLDYDGMFVPPMRGKLAGSESGVPAFQHPKRTKGYFNERMDDFGALTLLLTFACLRPNLWKEYYVNRGMDDRSLLFRQEDWSLPGRSRLLALLYTSPDPGVKKLAAIVTRAATGKLAEVPPFASVVDDSDIKRLLDPAWRPSPLDLAAVNAGPSCHVCRAPIEKKGYYCNRCGEPISGRVPPKPPVVKLSTSQDLIVRSLLIEGKTDAEIATRLSVSVPSVAAHMDSLKRLSATTSRTQLRAWLIAKIPKPEAKVTPKSPPPPAVAPAPVKPPAPALPPILPPPPSQDAETSWFQILIILLIVSACLWYLERTTHPRRTQLGTPAHGISAPPLDAALFPSMDIPASEANT